MPQSRKPVATVKKVATQTRSKNKSPLRVSGEQCFWVNNGPILADLNELQSALSSGSITDEQWRHHTAGGRNDFSNWIRYVFCNEALAKKVASAKTKSGAALAIRSSISK